jgi:pimeloyl-ACP methyl ester carboxylesterase
MPSANILLHPHKEKTKVEAKSRIIQTNGINMQITEQGEGPLVLLCHGFPELAYSWRHQLPALSRAGYQVVAPDQRGYGGTDCPDPIEAYNIFELVGDMVGLVEALGEEKAIIAGHDWGAPVAWYCTLLRPDIFRALILLSVPYNPRSWGNVPPITAMRQTTGEDNQFYIVYFQEEGKVESEMGADVRKTMVRTLFTLSGDVPPESNWRFIFGRDEEFDDTVILPDTLPPWLTEQDVDVFTEAFERTGFRGGVNWYRNIDRNWGLTPFLSGAQISQPSLFIAGERDSVITFSRAAYDVLEAALPNLSRKILIPGAGHWIQQERPQEVNNLIIDFLKELK